jgi:dTDP-4-dehydrorhamnose reductase
MIYLLGGTGYVGQEFQAQLKARGIAYKNISRYNFDYNEPDKLYNALSIDRPEFLINCAGYTGKPNVDACELDKANCLRGNAVLPGIIAEACKKLNIPWGHVSSGCIYTNNVAITKFNGWTEDDTPNFTFRSLNSAGGCSWYSGTKALGEDILKNYDNLYIWRLRIPFNNINNPRNYLSKLLNYNKLLNATNSLSNLNEFVSACIDCYLNKIAYGIYNVTNPGIVTTKEVIELIKKNKITDKEFSFFKNEEEFMQIAAKTPRSNCTLNSDKIIHTGVKLTEVHEALDRALNTWVN